MVLESSPCITLSEFTMAKLMQRCSRRNGVVKKDIDFVPWWFNMQGSCIRIAESNEIDMGMI